MKQLFIARHAKSDWGDMSARDFDRALSPRGLSNAPAMGQWLAMQGVQPQRIVTSPARRAAHTAQLLAQGMGLDPEQIVQAPIIYGAGTGELQSLIEQTDDSVQALMLVGHNPTLTQLVNVLGGGPLDNLPTAAVAALSFAIDSWRQITESAAQSAQIWRPKEVLG